MTPEDAWLRLLNVLHARCHVDDCILEVLRDSSCCRIAGHGGVVSFAHDDISAGASSIHLSLSIYIYIYIHVCIHIYIYIYIYIHRPIR